MTATTGGAQPAQPKRPGTTDGVISEFTIFAEIKPGHADALRKDLATLSGGRMTRGPVRHCTRSAPCTKGGT